MDVKISRRIGGTPKRMISKQFGLSVRKPEIMECIRQLLGVFGVGRDPDIQIGGGPSETVVVYCVATNDEIPDLIRDQQLQEFSEIGW